MVRTDKYVTMGTIKSTLEGAKADVKRSLEHLETVEELLNRFLEKHSPTQQVLLNDVEKPGYVYDVERWLIEERGFKTYSDFDDFLKRIGPKHMVLMCYEKTYRKLEVLTIIEIAKSCLSPIIHVNEVIK